MKNVIVPSYLNEEILDSYYIADSIVLFASGNVPFHYYMTFRTI